MSGRVDATLSASNIGFTLLDADEAEQAQDLVDELASVAFLGDFGSVKALLESPVQIDDPDRNGYTALQLACTSGRTECARLLLSAHANVNAKGGRGSGPLHAASRNGHFETAQLLLSVPGVLVDQPAKDGRTALHVAAEHDHNEVAQLLIEAGADVERRDRNGQTPLDVACASHGGSGSATARTLSAQENLSGLYRGRYLLTMRHERRERPMSMDEQEGGRQVQARFGEDVTTGDSVALLFFESRGDFERGYEAQSRLTGSPPPPPAPGMPPAMPSAGRVIEAFEDVSRAMPHCLVVDGWEQTLAGYLDARAGRLARNEAVYIAEGLLRSLHAVHALGLVHTLVCPATVARHWDGSWRLIDLHLLRSPGDDAATNLLPPRRRRQCCPPELLAIEGALRAAEEQRGHPEGPTAQGTGGSFPVPAGMPPPPPPPSQQEQEEEEQQEQEERQGEVSGEAGSGQSSQGDGAPRGEDQDASSSEARSSAEEEEDPVGAALLTSTSEAHNAPAAEGGESLRRFIIVNSSMHNCFFACLVCLKTAP